MKQGAGAPRELRTAEKAGHRGNKDRSRSGVATCLWGSRPRHWSRTTAPGLAAQPLSTRRRDRGRADGGTAPGPSSSLVPKPRAATAAARGRREAPPWSRETSLSGRAERREKGCRLGRAHGRGAGERRGALGEPREPEESRPTGQASRGPRPAPVCHAALAQPQRRGRAGGGQVRTSLGRASERRAPRGCPNPGPESTR